MITIKSRTKNVLSKRKIICIWCSFFDHFLMLKCCSVSLNINVKRSTRSKLLFSSFKCIYRQFATSLHTHTHSHTLVNTTHYLNSLTLFISVSHSLSLSHTHTHHTSSSLTHTVADYKPNTPHLTDFDSPGEIFSLSLSHHF